MINLKYTSDEVKEFHPIVNECLETSIKNIGLCNEFIVKHHFGEYTSGIPDFVILDKNTDDLILIIEVKKTPSDVFSQSTGYQAKNYVDEVQSLKWKPDYFPYFCVTNLEYIQTYCWRKNSSVIGCLIDGSPYYNDNLENLLSCKDKFIKYFENFLNLILSKKKPVFSSQLEAISESFNKTFIDISKILNANVHRMEKILGNKIDIKENVIFELLRFAFYYFIKEYYSNQNFKYSTNFPDFKVDNLESKNIIDLIKENFSLAMNIDFKDILTDSKKENSIYPYTLEINKDLRISFNNFINILNDNAKEGLKRNANVLNYVSLITSGIFNKDEMHKEGKIMSDEVLSDLLSDLVIDKNVQKVIDPCCGDGNLLVSAYNKIKKLNPNFVHNDVLKKLYGFEIDLNLQKLASFKLLAKKLLEINTDTFVNIFNEDLMNTANETYDIILMNPPFLRHEDLSKEKKNYYLNHLENISKKKSFIRNASQPNLYFFFIEKAISMLKSEGKAAIILMTKFLNNKDDQYLKEFLIDKIETILCYPPNFFGDFVVTTCIIILKKKSSKKCISFLKINNTQLFSDISYIKSLLNKSGNELNKDFSLVNVLRNNLSSQENWRIFFSDPESKYRKFLNLNFLVPINNHFKLLQRGAADNLGSSNIIFPFSNQNPLKSFLKNLEKEFIGFGMKNNKLKNGRRKIVLDEKSLNHQKGLHVNQAVSDLNKGNNFGLASYLKEFSKIKKNSSDIIKNSINSQVIPNIIIPRADRNKHIIFFNDSKKILLSTNFFYLNNPINFNKNISINKQIQFIVSYLNSSYGQIDFEINANNHEGLRKVEKFIINKIKIPDCNIFTETEIDNVVLSMHKIDNKNIDFSGLNDRKTRDELDFSLGEIFFKKNKLGFDNLKDFVFFFQDFLEELVKDRLYE